MNSNRTPIIVSILLNVVLAAVLLATLFGKKEEAVILEAAPAKIVTNTVTQTLYITNDAPKLVSKSVDWRSVESADYLEYIANMRSIGMPEETIRDVIIADVNKLFEARRKELDKDKPKFKYWETGQQMFAQMLNKSRIEQNQSMDREKRALLKTLLGDDVSIKVDGFAGINPTEIMQEMLGFLDQDKQNFAMETLQSFQADMAKTFGGGPPDSEDMENFLKAQKAMDEKLAARLTPQEYEMYQLTMSQTANTMRMQLGGFDPSEDEFKKVFALRKEFDDEFGMFGTSGLTQEKQNLRRESQKELDKQIAKALGKERYDDYKMASDWQFQGLAKAAGKQGLEKTAAKDLWNMKKLAEEKANELRANRDLSADQRNAALDAIKEETVSAMRQSLGDKGWESYSQSQGRYWIDQLARRPRNRQPTNLSAPAN